MKKDRDLLHLAHMVDAGEAILEFTASGYDDFIEDRKTRDAVVRNLEVIGEAVKRLGDAIRTENPHVPWRDIAGLRDIVIHQYDYVDYGEVWRIVENDLPQLLDDLRTILERRKAQAL